MKIVTKYTKKFENELRADGRALVWLALLFELLTLGYLAFLALFSLEMLLPTFVSTKISLVKFLLFLVLSTFLGLWLARLLSVRFPSPQFSPWLLLLTLTWLGGIFLLAFLKFPFWTIPILVVSLLFVCYLFFRLFSSHRESVR